jgi:hypothetical protein
MGTFIEGWLREGRLKRGTGHSRWSSSVAMRSMKVKPEIMSRMAIYHRRDETRPPGSKVVYTESGEGKIDLTGNIAPLSGHKTINIT